MMAGIDIVGTGNILVVGDSGVGKTTFVKRTAYPSNVDGNFVYQATIGADFTKLEIELRPGEHFRLMIIDIGGMDSPSSILLKSHCRNARGVLVVYDLTNRASFDNITKRWLPQLSEHIENFSSIPCTVIGNKLDMVKKKAALRQVNNDDIQSFMRAHPGIRCVEISAKVDYPIALLMPIRFMTIEMHIEQDKSTDNTTIKLHASSTEHRSPTTTTAGSDGVCSSNGAC